MKFEVPSGKHKKKAQGTGESLYILTVNGHIFNSYAKLLEGYLYFKHPPDVHKVPEQSGAVGGPR